MPARPRSFRVDAVVLRHSDWGEADRILGLFTLEMGKLRVIAKGVRKVRSRKAGHLEPFTRSTLQLAYSRDLPIITQAETLAAYLPLHDDILLTTYAAYVVELLDRFTYEEGENRGLFHLLTDTLGRLCLPEADPELTVRYYEMRLLDLVGFRPQLFHCLRCGKPIQAEDQYFSTALGGALCPTCGPDQPGARPISLNALRYLRHFQRSPYAEAIRQPPSRAAVAEMENVLQDYMTYTLERGLNTPIFLRRVKRGLLLTAPEPTAEEGGADREDVSEPPPDALG
jgi:DNA repair protein RecO (recombination protein O)